MLDATKAARDVLREHWQIRETGGEVAGLPEPRDQREELVRAAALILLEIDQLDMTTTAPSLAPD